MNLRRKLEMRKFRVHPLNAEEIMLVQRVKGSITSRRGTLWDNTFLDQFLAWITNLGVDRRVWGAFLRYRGFSLKILGFL